MYFFWTKYLSSQRWIQKVIVWFDKIQYHTFSQNQEQILPWITVRVVHQVQTNYKSIQPFPADPYYFMLFLASLIQQNNSYTKIKNIFYVINWVHKINNLPNPCEHNQVRLMKETAKRLVSRTKIKKLPVKPYNLIKIAKRNENEKNFYVFEIYQTWLWAI